jgi:hypothetical protein
MAIAVIVDNFFLFVCSYRTNYFIMMVLIMGKEGDGAVMNIVFV